SVSQAAALRDHVAAERAFLARTDAQHRAARPLVQRVRLELDAVAAEQLERVAQHQVLRLRVRGRALERRRDPRPADLDAAVVAIRVRDVRTDDYPIGCACVPPSQYARD